MLARRSFLTIVALALTGCGRGDWHLTTDQKRALSVSLTGRERFPIQIWAVHGSRDALTYADDIKVALDLAGWSWVHHGPSIWLKMSMTGLRIVTSPDADTSSETPNAVVLKSILDDAGIKSSFGIDERLLAGQVGLHVGGRL